MIANGVLYVTTVGNRVYAFASAGCGASTCRPLWNGVINPEVGNSTATDPPSVSHGALYVTAWVAGVTRFAVPGFPGSTGQPLRRGWRRAGGGRRSRRPAA